MHPAEYTLNLLFLHLSRVFPDGKFYLTGSRARGTATSLDQSTDIDVRIILPEERLYELGFVKMPLSGRFVVTGAAFHKLVSSLGIKLETTGIRVSCVLKGFTVDMAFFSSSAEEGELDKVLSNKKLDPIILQQVIYWKRRLKAYGAYGDDVCGFTGFFLELIAIFGGDLDKFFQDILLQDNLQDFLDPWQILQRAIPFENADKQALLCTIHFDPIHISTVRGLQQSLSHGMTKRHRWHRVFRRLKAIIQLNDLDYAVVRGNRWWTETISEIPIHNNITGKKKREITIPDYPHLSFFEDAPSPDQSSVTDLPIDLLPEIMQGFSVP